MKQFEHIDAVQAASWLKEGAVKLVDIRDPQSFAAGHIQDARHLSNENITQFLAETDKSTPVIVCCYHGNSSQQAAQFLIQQGFEQVYSLDGGFGHWRLSFPFVSG
ncbi:thiosulfate sulfurtransferase GlpE [Bowmanella dokdonensis]|uniref:Thiosulfate sulfurtransferase GlpE n=1 Tax=Bowmanella dokdonensis TaxID=751969 RepID=A0A939DJR1_9ALTE|nr:thiosulfate sulfurtransferase GlpE [Bowmanella dokdonensis]MBN7823602.1 thiosulfate sulfurtransferase GlpE [Bowmanella dokdonensis]